MAKNTLDSSVRIITRWMKRIGLNKIWQVMVEEKRLNGKHAEISWIDHRATIVINTNTMATMGTAEWEQILLHEVCHLLLAELEDWAHDEFEISGKLGAAFRRQSEICVDRIAIILMALYK